MDPNISTYTIIVIIIITIEISIFAIAKLVRNQFQWLIMENDEHPKLSKDGLSKFFDHGYDPELGWVRKPNTSHNEQGKFGSTIWNVNEKGSRFNPGFEGKESKISCYGDSYTFARQVNDDESWENFLSHSINTNVLNFGVGNYGIDQAFLRLKREYSKNKTKIVIIGVVPETISRILSIWKHYYEYGNTFAFKPKFVIKNNELQLIGNIMDTEKKFSEYEKFINKIQSIDYFYKTKFKKEILKFPYTLTLIKNLKRNIEIIGWILLNKIKPNPKYKWNSMRVIMRRNLQWRVNLYKTKTAVELLKQIIIEYVEFSRKEKFIPILMFMPQKDDLLFIKKNYYFFKNFENELEDIKDLKVFKITDELLKQTDLDLLYSDNNEYGGHFSKAGNKLVSEIVERKLKEINLC